MSDLSNKLINGKTLEYFAQELYKIINNKMDETKLFVGTYDEYQEAYTNGKIEIGAIVVITDEELDNSDSITSELGKAILGQMILK